MILLPFKIILSSFTDRSKKYLFRNLCNLGLRTVFYSTTNIINAQNDAHKIIIGNNCHIRGELFVFGHGGSIAIGDYCYLGKNSYVWSAKNIKIGNRVLISHNCNIFDSDTHPLNPEQRHNQFKNIITTGHPKEIDLKEEAVVIEDDVLIAANSIILKGVRLGRGAIVGAGSVVNRDVPPYAVVAGNPAKVIKELPVEGR